MIDFNFLNDQFLNMGAVHSPAELQGLLCGKLCGGVSLSADAWVQQALVFMDLAHLDPSEEQQAAFATLFQQTRDQLADSGYGFAPLLPEDEASLARRAEELGAWCKGFLQGLGTSALTAESKLSADAADMLRDLAQITQVRVDEDDDPEQSEAHWVELVEYVKVVVLNLYAEMGPDTGPELAASAAGDEDNQGRPPIIH